MRQPFTLLCAGLVLLVAYLCLVRLDNNAFWDDEAEDAFSAQNYVRTGSFSGWDGRNLYGYRNGAMLREDFSFRTPPLGRVLTAGAFRIFGVSTWSARIVPALAGIAAFLVVLWLYRDSFPDDNPGLLLAGAAFGLSPVFLLNVRQCRYYATALLCAVAAYAAYRWFLRKRHAGALAVLAAFATLLFYSNWMLCGAFLLSLATVHFGFHARELTKKEHALLAAAGIVFLAATIPYAIAQKIWVRPDFTPDTRAWPVSKLILFSWQVREMNTMNCLPWTTLAAFMAIACWRRSIERTGVRAAGEWLALGAANLLWIAVLSPQPTFMTELADVRYLIASVPFFLGAVGWILSWSWRRSKAGAVALLFVLVSCNGIAVAPGKWEFRWLLPAYVGELHRSYPTSTSETVAYLQEHAAQDDSVFVFAQHFNYPVMFYLTEKVRFCNQLNDKSSFPAAKAESLGIPLYPHDSFPDWLVMFDSPAVAPKLIAHYSRPHRVNGEPRQYRYEKAATLDVFWDQTQRPELFWHSFGPREVRDAAREGVTIYRKRGS